MSRFVMHGEVATAQFDWGSAGMRCDPPSTGCSTFVVGWLRARRRLGRATLVVAPLTPVHYAGRVETGPYTNR